MRLVFHDTFSGRLLGNRIKINVVTVLVMISLRFSVVVIDIGSSFSKLSTLDKLIMLPGLSGVF